MDIPLLPKDDGGYTIGRVLRVSANGLVAILSLGIIVGSTGQQVMLPLYLATFGAGGGPYYVLWFCALLFAVVFGVWSALLMVFKTGNITATMREWRWHKWMAVVGLFDAMNGLLQVYASMLTRNSGPLQAVLGQVYLPVTIVLSRVLLQKQYKAKQLLGAGLVLSGAIIALIPTMPQVAAPKPAATWWWPLVFMLSLVPLALMNIWQEKMQQHYRQELLESGRYSRHDELEFSALYFQFIESTYQWLCLTAFFWLDLVPAFGTSDSMQDFWANFTFGWHCTVNQAASHAMASSHCGLNAALGSIFISGYITVYVFGTLATRHASANMLACVSAVAPVLCVIFWFSFPSASIWAGQTPPGVLDAAFSGGALVIVLIGIFVFHKFTPVEPRGRSTSNAMLGVKNTVELLVPGYS